MINHNGPHFLPRIDHDSQCRLRLHRILFIITYILLAIIMTSLIQPAAASAPLRTYRLGIFPYMPPRQTVKYYGPIAADMEHVLHHPVKLESQRSFTAFRQALDLHTYDIALIQPFDYPDAVKKQGYIPLARLSVPLVTSFYVRSDSHYHKLQDLRGTTIAMPPASAANSRMALRALYDHHLLPGRDVNIRYFNSHDSCIQQVWVGDASACTTAPPPIKVFEKRMQAHLRSIYNTPPIPTILFVVSPRVPAEQRKKLKNLILDWGHTAHGKHLLNAMGFQSFIPIKPGEYDVLSRYEPLSAMASANSGHAGVLVLGIFPYISTRQLVRNFAPLLPAFSHAVDMPVRLQTASSFGGFSDNLIAGKYDIVLVQPYEFEEALKLGYIPLAGMKRLTFGTFYVRNASPYHHIIDFKNKTIAMAPAESAMSRLARRALIKAGLELGKDVYIKYVGNHDACLREVQRKAVAACASARVIIKMLPADFAQGLRTVGQTEKMPGVVFMAQKRLSKRVLMRLQKEILSWNVSKVGHKILSAMQFGEFEPVDPALYRHLPGAEK